MSYAIGTNVLAMWPQTGYWFSAKQTVWKDGLCGFRCRIWRDRIGHDTHFWIRTFANLVVAGGGGRLRWRRQSGAVHRRLCR